MYFIYHVWSCNYLLLMLCFVQKVVISHDWLLDKYKTNHVNYSRENTIASILFSSGWKKNMINSMHVMGKHFYLPAKNPKIFCNSRERLLLHEKCLLYFFYRDSFGENEEGGLLSLQDQPGLPSASTAASDRPSSSSTLVATPPSSSSTSSVILQTTRDHTSAYVSSQTRRKNYIIFEQNDEDTLI